MPLRWRECQGMAGGQAKGVEVKRECDGAALVISL